MAKHFGFEPYISSGHFIFMSYRDDEYANASEYARHFHDNGINVFYDAGNQDFQTLFQTIRQENCAGLVLIASDRSLKSQLIVDELQKALYSHKPVLCIYKENITQMDTLTKAYLSSARTIAAWDMEIEQAKQKALSGVRKMISGDVDDFMDDDDDVITTEDGKWKILSDSTVELKRYIGKDTDYAIPQTVENYTVTAIGDRAFNCCEELLSVLVPDGVISIGENSFSGCSSLESVIMPNSVVNIGYDAFQGCRELDSVTIPGYVAETQRLFSVLFKECAKSMHVTIANGAKTIGYSSFKGCANLASIKIPDGVTSIDEGAFSACHKLTSVKIPDSVTSIGNEAFYACIRLKVVTLPDNVDSIGDWAFCDCNGITSIYVPGSITNIGDSAFSNCPNLTIRSNGGVFSPIKKYANKFYLRYKKVK